MLECLERATGVKMSKRRAMEQVGWLGDRAGGDDDSDKEIKEDVGMSPPSKASRMESDSCAGDSATTKRVEKEEEEKAGGENLMRVYQWWPTKSHQFQVTFRMNVGEDDTLFTALATTAAPLFQPAAQVTISHYPTIPTSGQQIRAELAGFGSENEMWKEYCHHIYMQHQKSCSQLRFTDLTTANQAQHSQAKEIYMEYMGGGSGARRKQEDMPTAPGSLLELIFASLKYKINSIVLQFIPDKSHFVAYNFNPQWCRRRAYFVNVGEPEGGKWRSLSYLGLSSGSSLILGGAGNETLPLLQSGVYKTEGADVERTVLELRMVEAGGDGNKVLRGCNLQLFSRLLTGTARPDELTLVLAKGEHDDADDDDKDQLVTIAPKSVQYILPPREPVDGLSDKSSFAFKSIENLADCKEWCKRITQAQEPRVVQVNPFISRQPHDSITVPFLLGPNDHLVRHGPAPELTSAPEAKVSAAILGQVDDEDERSGSSSLEFSPIENNSAVQVAILGLNSENGLEEIMLKFSQGGELFQRANHNLFFNVIVKSSSSGKLSPAPSIHLELFNPETDQYEPAAASERPQGSFRVDKGTTFHLFNPASSPTIQLRCAWFPSQ